MAVTKSQIDNLNEKFGALTDVSGTTDDVVNAGLRALVKVVNSSADSEDEKIQFNGIYTKEFGDQLEAKLEEFSDSWKYSAPVVGLKAEIKDLSAGEELSDNIKQEMKDAGFPPKVIANPQIVVTLVDGRKEIFKDLDVASESNFGLPETEVVQAPVDPAVDNVSSESAPAVSGLSGAQISQAQKPEYVGPYSPEVYAIAEENGVSVQEVLSKLEFEEAPAQASNTETTADQSSETQQPVEAEESAFEFKDAADASEFLESTLTQLVPQINAEIEQKTAGMGFLGALVGVEKVAAPGTVDGNFDEASQKALAGSLAMVSNLLDIDTTDKSASQVIGEIEGDKWNNYLNTLQSEHDAQMAQVPDGDQKTQMQAVFEEKQNKLEQFGATLPMLGQAAKKLEDENVITDNLIRQSAGVAGSIQIPDFMKGFIQEFLQPLFEMLSAQFPQFVDIGDNMLRSTTGLGFSDIFEDSEPAQQAQETHERNVEAGLSPQEEMEQSYVNGMNALRDGEGITSLDDIKAQHEILHKTNAFISAVPTGDTEKQASFKAATDKALDESLKAFEGFDFASLQNGDPLSSNDFQKRLDQAAETYSKGFFDARTQIYPDAAPVVSTTIDNSKAPVLDPNLKSDTEFGGFKASEVLKSYNTHNGPAFQRDREPMVFAGLGDDASKTYIAMVDPRNNMFTVREMDVAAFETRVGTLKAEGMQPVALSQKIAAEFEDTFGAVHDGYGPVKQDAQGFLNDLKAAKPLDEVQVAHLDREKLPAVSDMQAHTVEAAFENGATEEEVQQYLINGGVDSDDAKTYLKGVTDKPLPYASIDIITENMSDFEAAKWKANLLAEPVVTLRDTDQGQRIYISYHDKDVTYKLEQTQISLENALENRDLNRLKDDRRQLTAYEAHMKSAEDHYAVDEAGYPTDSERLDLQERIDAADKAIELKEQSLGIPTLERQIDILANDQYRTIDITYELSPQNAGEHPLRARPYGQEFASDQAFSQEYTAHKMYEQKHYPGLNEVQHQYQTTMPDILAVYNHTLGSGRYADWDHITDASRPSAQVGANYGRNTHSDRFNHHARGDDASYRAPHTNQALSGKAFEGKEGQLDKPVEAGTARDSKRSRNQSWREARKNHYRMTRETQSWKREVRSDFKDQNKAYEKGYNLFEKAEKFDERGIDGREGRTERLIDDINEWQEQYASPEFQEQLRDALPQNKEKFYNLNQDLNYYKAKLEIQLGDLKASDTKMSANSSAGVPDDPAIKRQAFAVLRGEVTEPKDPEVRAMYEHEPDVPKNDAVALNH